MALGVIARARHKADIIDHAKLDIGVCGFELAQLGTDLVDVYIAAVIDEKRHIQNRVASVVEARPVVVAELCAHYVA